MKQWVGSLLFSFGTIFTVIFWGSALLCCAPFPSRYRMAIARHWTGMMVRWLRITCGIDYQLHGTEHLQHTSGSLVLSKHQSTFETFLLLAILPRCRIVLKRELLWVPFFGWALALLSPIAINRGSPSAAMKQLIREGKKKLQQGDCVLMFPEGTRIAAGARVEYKKGAFVLAAATRGSASIIPVAHNAGLFWPRKGFVKKPGTIQVYIGAPVATINESADALQEKIATWIDSHSA